MATPRTDVVAQIEKLASLHAAGILTDQEFAAKKAELLSRL
ncbi:SHOCT domain-containing protein [Actinoplanes sp. CA-131856]